MTNKTITISIAEFKILRASDVLLKEILADPALGYLIESLHPELFRITREHDGEIF
jgi:hypothetical protein